MNKHYTSIEQSKKLLELGLNPESADMAYPYGHKYPIIKNDNKFFNEEKFNIFSLFYPCWSVGALLEVMPINTTLDHEKNGWWCNVNYDIIDIQNGYEDNSIKGDSSIEAVYNMIVWLLENGYIKKEKL